MFPRPGYVYHAAFERPIWTPAGFVARGEAFVLTCKACGVEKDAPLQALIERGDGDRAMSEFRGRWACACGSRDVAGKVG